MSVSIKIDTREAERMLAQAQKQIPFALQLAVNDLAFQAQRAEQSAFGSIFAHPRPFTMRSVEVLKGSKTDPTATLKVRDAQARYLAPYEIGGVHATPGRALLNPKNVTLDQYGQLTRDKIKKLTAQRDKYFVGTIHGVRGVWQRLTVAQQRRAAKAAGGNRPSSAHRLKLIIRFGDALPVHKHLDFVVRGEELVRQRGPQALRDAVTRVLATAR